MHIHLCHRATYDDTDSSGSNAMQVFFDQTLIDTLATSLSFYSTEGQNSTTNASDHVYTGEEQGTTLLTLSGSTEAGYTATFTSTCHRERLMGIRNPGASRTMGMHLAALSRRPTDHAPVPRLQRPEVIPHNIVERLELLQR